MEDDGRGEVAGDGSDKEDNREKWYEGGRGEMGVTDRQSRGKGHVKHVVVIVKK